MSSPSEKHSSKHERSRNARAQARHRAKRKAYVEQLEENVARMQAVLGMPPEDLDTVARPAVVKIRELETQNAILVDENKELRRRLSQYEAPSSTSTSDGHFEHYELQVPTSPAPDQHTQQPLLYQLRPNDDPTVNPAARSLASLPMMDNPRYSVGWVSTPGSFQYAGTSTYANSDVPSPHNLVPPSPLSPISPTSNNSSTAAMPGLYTNAPYMKDEEDQSPEYPSASSSQYMYNSSYHNGPPNWPTYSHERRN